MINFLKNIRQKIKFIQVFWVFLYILIFSLLIRGGFSYLDPDFGWHLKAGQEISINHTVPRVNLYNYTYTGNWVDHEWLSNLFCYQIYSHIGYEALVFIFAGLIILTLIILNLFVYRTLKHKVNFWIMAIFELFGVLASLPSFGVRIQEISLLFVLFLLIIINQYNKSKNWQILLLLPPIFYLWANLHASFLMGFCILFIWVALKLIEKIASLKGVFQFLDFSEVLEFKQIGLFSVFVLVSVLATFLTPYKLELFNFLSSYKNTAYLSLIQEWLPQFAIPIDLSQLIYLSFSVIALVLYVYYCVKDSKGLNAWQLASVIIFLMLSFQSRRNFPLLFIVSFSLIVEVYSRFFAVTKIAYQRWLKALVIFCFIILIITECLTIKFVRDPFNGFCDHYPCGAINFIKNNPKYNNSNIFNNYGWGGFLLWTLPERKLFIDGRLPQISFADSSLIEEYYSLFINKNMVVSKLATYNIKLVLLDITEEPYIFKKWEKILFGFKNDSVTSKNYLREYLDKSTDWSVIYQDKTAKIYFYIK